MGRSVRCSVCGNAVYVPGARSGDVSQRVNQEVQAWIRVVCNCGKVIKSPPEWAGKKGHCPRCGMDHIMPTTAPTNVVGEHEVEEVLENTEGPKPVKSLVKPTPEAKPPTPPGQANLADRPAPRPQPKSDAPDIAPAEGEAVDDATIEKFVEGQTLHKSGLLDLTGREEVRILDGVAPALWDAKRAQRAKAIKSGPGAQVGYYRRRAFTEQLAHIRKKIDEVLYRSPAATLVLSGVVLLASSLFLYWQVTGTIAREGWKSKASNAYYYDLSSNKLFVHIDSDVPPIVAPEQTEGDPMGVRAHVFSCGKCDEPSSLYVGFLEMYDPKTDAGKQFRIFRELLASKGPSAEAAEAEDKAEAGRLVSRGAGESWVQADSEAGQRVIANGARDCESGEAPKPCGPPVGVH
jgi:hypothetical protein